ncbi:MAG TPA: hypothetical protein VMA71_01650 [Alloacidobacterium sp.]|nr:hypothetical protein [Alloacidobacterium sp.]
MNQIDQSQLHALQAMLVFMPFFVLIGAIIVIIPYWMIWKKAGFSPWFSLLMFVPLVNLVMLYVLAFAEWKVVPIVPAAPAYSYPPTSFPPPQA